MRNLLIPAVFAALLLVSGCEENWYYPLIGEPSRGSIDGVIKDSSTIAGIDNGINDCFVGLTPSADAYLFDVNYDTMVAKCVGGKTSTFDGGQTFQHGYYRFSNISMDMNSKYILVYKAGYVTKQVPSNFVKNTTTRQPTIVLNKK